AVEGPAGDVLLARWLAAEPFAADLIDKSLCLGSRLVDTAKVTERCDFPGNRGRNHRTGSLGRLHTRRIVVRHEADLQVVPPVLGPESRRKRQRARSDLTRHLVLAAGGIAERD